MTPYVVEYSYCAIAFLLIIFWNYFSSRQFPGFAHKIFRLELVCSLLNVTSDLIGAYTIPLALSLPHWVNFLVNTAYYALELTVPALLLVYILAIAGFREKEIPTWVFLPYFFGVLVVLTNPINRLVFFIDPVLGYTRGIFFSWLFGICVLYILLSLIALNRYRRRVTSKQYWATTLFVIVVVSAATVQFSRPNLLLSGPSIAFAITMMYLTIQKPDDMLDITTGVFNGTALMQMLRDNLIDGHEFQATLIVLNRMSRLDSLLGYESLNRLLAELGRFLLTELPDCLAFRLAGSTRFVLLTRRAEDHARALESVRKRFTRPWLKDEYDVLLPASVFTLWNSALLGSADEFNGLINDAVNGLSESGDADYSETVLDESSLDAVRRRSEVEGALLNAIENDLLQVYFQPIYAVNSGSFEHAEALLRFPWQDGMISPAEFIPVAEQNGLILRIDALVLGKVGEFIRENAGRLADAGLNGIGVNLSAVEFMRSDLVESVVRSMEARGVNTKLICLEMTETAASGSFSETKRLMEKLGARGFRFALDDFGTGFANISQVVRLPFDIAKLDRSILTEGGYEAGNLAVLRNSIRMFKEMNVKIVAEGAETRAEAELLTGLDVDYIQGYYYARPMPADQYLRFLEKAAEDRKT